MASKSRTRLYFSNNTTPFTPTNNRGAWDQTASSVIKKLDKLPGGAATTVGIAETNVTNNWDVLLARFVSDAITHDQVISGTVNWAIGVLESSASANDFTHIHIYVTQGDTDVVRGTLLTDSISATEWPTTTGVGKETSAAMSAVTALKGDRIVVEIGYQGQNVVTTSFTGTINYGGTSGGDLQAAGTRTRPGWIDFDGKLFQAIPHKSLGRPVLNKQHPLARGLKIDLPLFEGAGANTVLNIANGKHYALQDVTWVTGPMIAKNKRLAMNALHANDLSGGSHIIIPGNDLGWWANKVTIAFFVKQHTQNPSDQGLLDSQWGGGHGGLQSLIGGNSNNLSFRAGSSTVDSTAISAALTTDVWHFIVMVIDTNGTTGNIFIYRDGVQQGTTAMNTTADPPTGGGGIYALSAQSDQSGLWGMEIAGLRMWNRVLNVKAIKDLNANYFQIYEKFPALTDMSYGLQGKAGGLVTRTLTFTADGVIQVQGNTKTFTADGMIKVTNTFTFTTDGVITQLTGTFFDNFNTTIGTKWNDWGAPQFAIVNQQLVATSTLAGGYFGMDTYGDSSLFPGHIYDLRSSYIQSQVVDAGNQAIASWEVYPVVATVDDGVFNNQVHFLIALGVLYARHNISGANTVLASVTYNAAVHKWFRIRESGGTTFWEYSTDGVAWSSFASESNPFALNHLRVGLQIGTWQAESSTTSATFDNFNVVRTNLTFTADGVIKVTGNTKTFTADGLILTRSTSTFTADGIIKATTLNTFTTDGIVKVLNNTVTFTADGIIKAIQTAIITADGVVKVAGNVKTFTADGIIKATTLATITADGVVKVVNNTFTFTADGLVKVVTLATFTTDGIIKAIQTSTITSDGIVKVLGNLKTFTTDGIIKATTLSTFTADGVIKATTLLTFTTDGIIDVTGNSKTFTADGVVLVQGNTKTITADGIVLVKGNLSTFTSDGIVKATTTQTFTTDGVIKATQTKTFTVDGIIDTEGILLTFTVDGIIKATQTQTFTTDGIVLVTKTATITADGIIKATTLATFTTDGIIKATILNTFTADAVVITSGSTKTFTADGVIFATNTASFTADGIIDTEGVKLTFTADGIVRATTAKTFTVDGIIDTEGIVKTFTVDGIILATETSTITTDGIVKVLGNTSTFTADGIVKTTNTQPITVDGIVRQTAVQTITADGVIKAVTPITFTADGIILAVGNITTFTVDGVIIVSHATITFTVDGFISQLATFTVDGIIAGVQFAPPGGRVEESDWLGHSTGGLWREQEHPKSTYEKLSPLHDPEETPRLVNKELELLDSFMGGSIE